MIFSKTKIRFYIILALIFCLNTKICYSENTPSDEPVFKITPAGIPLMSCIELTLSQQPNILIQQATTEFNKGSYIVQQGTFDTFFNPTLNRTETNTPLSSYDSTVYEASKQNAKITQLGVDFKRKLRNGISLNPTASVTENDTSNDLEPKLSRSTVAFVVTIPLLRDFGRDATGAAEMAAERDYQASLAQLRFVTSQNILNTTLAYWNYVAAKRSVDIVKESEDRARELVEKTKLLIEKGEKPRADLDQLEANLADKTATRIRQEQTLTEAKQSLGIAIGVKFEQIDALPEPADHLPEISANPYPSLEEKDALIKAAWNHRGDLQSAKMQEESADILLTSAKNGLLHRLDLNLSAGYSGLSEGTGAGSFFDSVDKNISGFDSKAGVSYEWPFENRSARGTYLQARSTLKQRQLQTYDLKRKIGSRVATAILALKRSSMELTNSIQAYQLYEKAVQSEKEKLRLGMSTFIDVIDIEDRLLSTKLNHVSAHQRYANALAQLRFETGTFFTYKEEKHRILEKAFETIPLRDIKAQSNEE